MELFFKCFYLVFRLKYKSTKENHKIRHRHLRKTYIVNAIQAYQWWTLLLEENPANNTDFSICIYFFNEGITFLLILKRCIWLVPCWHGSKLCTVAQTHRHTKNNRRKHHSWRSHLRLHCWVPPHTRPSSFLVLRSVLFFYWLSFCYLLEELLQGSETSRMQNAILHAPSPACSV